MPSLAGGAIFGAGAVLSKRVPFLAGEGVPSVAGSAIPSNTPTCRMAEDGTLPPPSTAPTPYGQQADGMHPIGMLSCFQLCLSAFLCGKASTFEPLKLGT